MKTKIVFFIYLLVFSYCSNSDSLSSAQSECINSISMFSTEKTEPITSFYVVGHGYGNHDGNNLGLSNKIINYFKDFDYKPNIIFTGDVIRDSNKENLELLLSQLNLYFNEYYIAPGNHEIVNAEEYYKIFKKDLNYLSYGLVDFYIINTTTDNWKPTPNDQFKINERLNKSSSQIDIFFNHQIFWENIVKEEIRPNGYNFLKVELTEYHLDWMDRIPGKPTIFISGDFGRGEESLFCEYIDSQNILFIGNGIYDQNSDKIIKIKVYKTGFDMEIINLN